MSYMEKLFRACERGQINKVKLLLKADDSIKEQCINNALTKACRNGNTDLIQLLIDNTDCTYHTWENCLIGACEGGHINLVRYFISKGAKWESGFSYACKSGNLELVKLIIEKANLCEVRCWNLGLYSACQNGHVNVVNLMIDKGATHWNGGLLAACESGHLQLVKYMIDLGADQWNIAVIRCCENPKVQNHDEIMKILFKKGLEEDCNFLNDNIEYISQCQGEMQYELLNNISFKKINVLKKSNKKLRKYFRIIKVQLGLIFNHKSLPSDLLRSTLCYIF